MSSWPLKACPRGCSKPLTVFAPMEWTLSSGEAKADLLPDINGHEQIHSVPEEQFNLLTCQVTAKHELDDMSIKAFNC